MNYYISDLHFGHARLNEKIDCRGFESTEQMDPIMQAVGSGWTETGMVYRNVTILHRMATCLPIP